jgi:ABC-type enterochelin transport system permease subunit
LNFIGKINPPLSKVHHFVLVVAKYFTKGTEIVPLINKTHEEVIEFIIEYIIYRFGISQTLSTNQVTSCMFIQVREFVESYKIKLLNSSPCYDQVNDQVEYTNKTLIKLIKK